jgi:hypothetical protein
MDKEPIFQIASIEQKAKNEHYSIQGKAFDRINPNDYLYIFSQLNNNSCFIVEDIETKGRQIKSAYAFMEVTLKGKLIGDFLEIDGRYLYDIVDDYKVEIDFQQAKQIAETTANDKLSEFRKNPEINLLRDEFYEAECCWFFFRNKEIIGPPERTLSWDQAYAVCKKGNCFLIADMSDKIDELKEHIQRFSSHLKRRRE